MTAMLGAAAIAAPAAAEETPKYGGTLNYMIPADAPPSFDAHREVTYATIHSAAPFYSTLIRINPYNPAATTDFVCDLCTTMPQPTGRLTPSRSVKGSNGTTARRCQLMMWWRAGTRLSIHPKGSAVRARASS